MEIATLLFTYLRPEHTKKTIDALKSNSILPEKLFIFHDGYRTDSDKSKWEAVSEIIHSVDWCSVEIIENKTNSGLSESIISGIQYAFKDYDAIIVLEDDCVTDKNFMAFMNTCLTKYKNSNVYSVSGYAWPIDVYSTDYDIYGCGRICSYGWGTWKEKWGDFVKDYNVLHRIYQNQAASRRLAMWGNDLEKMLISQLKGNVDSWAVFWALKVIEEGGICINPYRSLVSNIGFDGSGEHSANSGTQKEKNVFNKIIDSECRFPEKVEIDVRVSMEFAKLYGSQIALELDDKKENILVWGCGDYLKEHVDDVAKEFNVLSFVDKKRKGYFAGIPITTKDKIKEFKYDKILIMAESDDACSSIKKDLYNLGVVDNENKVIIGKKIWERDYV